MRLRASVLFGAIALTACVVPMTESDIIFRFNLPGGTSAERTVVLSDTPYLTLEAESCVNPPSYYTPPLAFALEFDPKRVQVAPDSIRLQVSAQQRRVLRVQDPQVSQFHHGMALVLYRIEGDCDDLNAATLYIEHVRIDGNDQSYGPMSMFYKYGQHTEFRHFNNDPR